MRQYRKWVPLLLVIAIALPLIVKAAPAQADYLICVNELTVTDTMGTPHPVVSPSDPLCKAPSELFTVAAFDSGDCTVEVIGPTKVCWDLIVHRPPVG